MNWADIAKKNCDKVLTPKAKKGEKKHEKRNISLYPEDLFDLRYSDNIQELYYDFKKLVYDREASLLNNKFEFHDLYEFIVYYTDLEPFAKELLESDEEDNEKNNNI